MTTTPGLLLETSIAQLRTLASFLTEEMDQYRHETAMSTPEARACKEILLTISVLIPKLQAARDVVSDSTLVGAAPSSHTYRAVDSDRRCANCEDS